MDFDYVTQKAKNVAGMNNREKVRFHCFNPNGLCKEKRMLDQKISKLVDKKIVKSGWIIAYGSFDDFCYNGLMDLLEFKKVNSRKLAVAIKMLQERNEKVKTKLSEIKEN